MTMLWDDVLDEDDFEDSGCWDDDEDFTPRTRYDDYDICCSPYCEDFRDHLDETEYDR